MTTDLKRTLASLAARSVNYADADRVIRAVRRRRRRRAMITAPVFAVVTAVAAAVGLGAVAPTHTTRPPTVPAEFALPPTISVPANAPLLPSDRPVGRAVAAYRECLTGCPTYLVMGNGRQYRIDVTPVKSTNPIPNNWVEISPDGRWLAVTTGGITMSIRDLLGTAVTPVKLVDVSGWSPNGQFVMGSTYRGPVVLDATTGSVITSADAIAVTDEGEAAQIDNPAREGPNESAPYLLVQWMPFNETDRVNAQALLHKGESVALSSTWPVPDGTSGQSQWGAAASPQGQLAVSVYNTHIHGTKATNVWWTRTAVLIGSLAKATVTRRVALPAGSGAPFFYQEQLTYSTQSGPDAPIVLHAETPSGFVPVTRLPAKSEYVIAGMQLPTLGPAYLQPWQ
jgi:hypothetical protein